MGASRNNPSLDPADNGSLSGTISFVFSKLMQQTNGMLPAQVIAYDRTKNRVQVSILITMLTTDGTIVPRSQIASIPVLVLGGGGYFLSFPLNPGDLGWIAANDRDISLFLQSYSQSPPNTTRMFDFSDGLFIPDIMKGYTINTEDAANAVLSNLDGSVRIALWPTMVKITSPTVEINGQLAVDGGITITGVGSTPINLTGNVALTGTLTVTGDITATGSITPFF
jgi:hypothetical protein